MRRAAWILLLTPWASAADGTALPEIAVHGVGDFRYQHVAAQRGWADEGLGKLRTGGKVDRLRVDEAALSLHARLWDWAATVTLKHAAGQKQSVDLTEAFVSYRPVSTSAWRFGSRIGAFFPPVSLENTGIAWTSPYTLTSSVINTWIGEELRVIGGEGNVSYQLGSGDRLGIVASGFANNDTAGTLLAWRGWNLHGYEATLQDRLPLPAGIGISSFFPLQASLTRPIVEVDGRPGYYAGLTAERASLYKLRALYYDNRADPTVVEHGQYGWHTRFWSLGAKLNLPWELELIGQGITGRTTMGDKIAGKHAVDVGYWAASWLLSRSFGKQRLSLRHDRFGTDENDALPEDRNGEAGYAWTVNYNITLARRHQLNLELSHVVSDRPARTRLDLSSQQEETLWQVGYRLFF